MHLWRISESQTWQVARLWKKMQPSPPSLTPLSLSFLCNVLQCRSSLDLVKWHTGVAWQQPSAALSFQSPCSAVRLPPESCQDFPLFLHRSNFPSALPNNSNILSNSMLRIVLLLSSFPPFINRLPLPTHRMSKPGSHIFQCNLSCLCYSRLSDTIGQSVINSIPIILVFYTNGIFPSAVLGLYYHTLVLSETGVPVLFIITLIDILLKANYIS